MLAGSAPERSTIDKSLACCSLKASGDAAHVANAFLDPGHFLNLAVKHNGEEVADVGGGEGVKTIAAIARQVEADRRTAILVVRRFGSAQIAAGDGRRRGSPRNRCPAVLRWSRLARPMLRPFMTTESGGRIAAMRGQRRRFRGIAHAVVHRLPDLQHGGGLHDVLNPGRIVDARQLHQDLVLAQPVLLNDRLADAELVNAIADGLDGLLDSAALELRERLLLHGQDIGALGARYSVCIRGAARLRSSSDRRYYSGRFP